MEAQLEKENRMLQLSTAGHSYSHDSAIDNDLQEWDTEMLSIDLVRHTFTPLNCLLPPKKRKCSKSNFLRILIGNFTLNWMVFSIFTIGAELPKIMLFYKLPKCWKHIVFVTKKPPMRQITCSSLYCMNRSIEGRRIN